ncbi:MAG: carboxypeptidase regulatory-like domain-containing protein [Candidatus Latescibacteria bacterium]|nr:carboxypeptidase regulatory-like domain-containing protein [Candidatus Latescibacterota bacterium]
MKKLPELILILIIAAVAGCLTGDSGDDNKNNDNGSYIVSGKITDNTGANVSGVTVTLSGSNTNLTVTTDSGGNYAFQDIIIGSYTVTPAKKGYTFTPESRSIDITDLNKTGVNFNCVPVGNPDEGNTDPNGHTVTGRIVDIQGNVVPGIELSLTSTVNRYTAITDENGVFTFTGIPDAAYALLPIGGAPNYSYIPQSQRLSVSGANITTEDFLQYKLGQPGDYNIWGAITTLKEVIMPDVVLTLDFENRTVTSDKEGNYYFGNLGDGDYTVTPSRDGFLFTPESAQISIRGADVELNFKGIGSVDGWIVSGHIVHEDGTGVPDVIMSITNPVNRYEATTEEDGSFMFVGVANGSYGLVHNKMGYTFTPSYQTFSVSDANVVLDDIIGSTGQNDGKGYTISGRVVDAAGNGITGVQVGLSGTMLSTLTDSYGNYSFTSIENNEYYVIVAKTDYTFAPMFIAITVNGENVSVSNIIGYTSGGGDDGEYVITGLILNSSGAGVEGIAVNLTASGMSNIKATNENGVYTYPEYPNGTYTVTPESDDYTFTPASVTVTIQGGNVTVQTIIATPNGNDDGEYIISGSILTLNGTGIEGIAVNLTASGMSNIKVTNENGVYTYPEYPNGTYTVTPESDDFTFTPASVTVTIQGSDVTVQTIIAIPVDGGGGNDDGEYIISGSILTATGAGIEGIAVDLTGPGMSNIKATNENGVYTYPEYPNGTYTVTPESDDYTFSPASVTFTVQGSDVTVQTIVGTPVGDDSGDTGTYLISGHVYNIDGNAYSGVTIIVGGDIENQTLTTDQNGYYYISNLANGNYMIVPSSAMIVFSPLYMMVTINGENATVDFHEYRKSDDDDAIYKISGTVSDQAGSGIPGVSLMLTGGNIQKTAVTDNEGKYEISDLSNALYSLIPQKSGYKFSPLFAQVTINGTNATANFIGSPATDDGGDTFALSGKVIDKNGVGIADVQVDINDIDTNNMLVGRTKTDSDGIYTFEDLFKGDFYITAAKADYSFNPSPLRVIVTGPSTEIADIHGTKISGNISDGPRKISGRVTKVYDEDAGIPFAIIKLEQKDTEDSLKVSTNGDGYYTFDGVPDGEYYVIPRHENFIFDNERKGIELDGEDLADVNFKGAHYIAGHVYEEKEKLGGAKDETVMEPKGGVKVKMTRLDWSGFTYGTVMTDALGYYEFRLLLNPGEYKVETPDEDKDKPEFHEVIIEEENHLDVDFVIPLDDDNQEPDNDDDGGGNIMNFWLEITCSTTQETTERNDEQTWKGTANFVAKLINDDGTGVLEGEGELKVSGGGHSQDDKGNYCDWTRTGTIAVTVSGSTLHTIDPDDDKIKHMLNISLGMASSETVTTTCCDDEGNCKTEVNRGGAQDLPFEFMMPMVEGYTIARTIEPGGGFTGRVIYVLHYGSNE